MNSGMNGISLEDVNSCGVNVQIFHSPSLKNISDNLYPIMGKWGITPYFSACYAAPYLMANISSDPSNPLAEKWWVEQQSDSDRFFCDAQSCSDRLLVIDLGRTFLTDCL